jgi:hypothetical protein
MNNHNLVEIEPVEPRRQFSGRVRSNGQLRKADIQDIAASETLVLATAMAQAVLTGLDMREKRKMQKLLLYIAGGFAILTGIASLVMQIVKV